MSESDEHKMLVQLMAEGLASIDGQIEVRVDSPDSDMKPPLIRGYRPDVHGMHKTTGAEYICEAKTLRDLKTKRSYEQISAFVAHTNQESGRRFILGSYGGAAVRAKTILRFIVQGADFRQNSMQVFDGCDYWSLDSESKKIWDLL